MADLAVGTDDPVLRTRHGRRPERPAAPRRSHASRSSAWIRSRSTGSSGPMPDDLAPPLVHVLVARRRGRRRRCPTATTRRASGTAPRSRGAPRRRWPARSRPTRSRRSPGPTRRPSGSRSRDSNQIAEPSGRTTRYMTSSQAPAPPARRRRTPRRRSSRSSGWTRSTSRRPIHASGSAPTSSTQALTDGGHDAAFVEHDHEVGRLLDERTELRAAQQQLALGRLLASDVTRHGRVALDAAVTRPVHERHLRHGDLRARRPRASTARRASSRPARLDAAVDEQSTRPRTRSTRIVADRRAEVPTSPRSISERALGGGVARRGSVREHPRRSRSRSSARTPPTRRAASCSASTRSLMSSTAPTTPAGCPVVVEEAGGADATHRTAPSVRSDPILDVRVSPARAGSCPLGRDPLPVVGVDRLGPALAEHVGARHPDDVEQPVVDVDDPRSNSVRKIPTGIVAAITSRSASWARVTGASAAPGTRPAPIPSPRCDPTSLDPPGARRRRALTYRVIQEVS